MIHELSRTKLTIHYLTREAPFGLRPARIGPTRQGWAARLRPSNPGWHILTAGVGQPLSRVGVWTELDLPYPGWTTLTRSGPFQLGPSRKLWEKEIACRKRAVQVVTRSLRRNSPPQKHALRGLCSNDMRSISYRLGSDGELSDAPSCVHDGWMSNQHMWLGRFTDLHYEGFIPAYGLTRGIPHGCNVRSVSAKNRTSILLMSCKSFIEYSFLSEDRGYVSSGIF